MLNILFLILCSVFMILADSMSSIDLEKDGDHKDEITHDTFSNILNVTTQELDSNVIFPTNKTEQIGIDNFGSLDSGVVAPTTKPDMRVDVRVARSNCSSHEEGNIRYNKGLKVLEFCNGEKWAVPGSLTGAQGLKECPSKRNDIMVPVGPWCVDKYEASVWSGEGGSGTQYFHDSSNQPTTDTNQRHPFGQYYPTGCNRDGSGCTQYAASKPGVIPARGLSWYQAVRFCANSGKVLIPDSVWQMAAIGTHDPQTNTGTGGSDGGLGSDHDNARCNINTNHTTFSDWGGWVMPHWGARPTGRAGKTPGSSLACISDFGVEDMIGNVWEWTDLNGVSSGVDQAGFSQGKISTEGGPFNNDATWNVNSSAYSCDGKGESLGSCGWANNAPSAALRGGCWGLGPLAGVTALTLSASGSSSRWSFGFRCALPR